MAKPGTGASETGEPSILLGMCWGDDDEAVVGDAGADVEFRVGVMGFGVSGCGSLVGEDAMTCAGVGLVNPEAWV